MLGAVLIVLVLLAIPSILMISGMLVAIILGETNTGDAEARYEGSELLDLTR